MKIETVTISGLRSHRGDPPSVVDLSGKSLVAVVGPTGAGKSSILEAICFALYGEATFGGKAYRELATDGRSEIAVQLIFTVGEDRYQLVRSVSPDRKGEFKSKAAWLRRVDSDGNALSHVDQVRKVDGAVRGLLGGMDRLQFCQAVLLAQNRFAELLETDERKRNELLDILLGLTALADARKALQVTDRLAKRNEERLADRRSGLPADPAAAAAAAGVRASATAELAVQARQAARTLGDLVDGAAALSSQAGALRAAAALPVAGRDGFDLLTDLEARFETLAGEDARISAELEEAKYANERASRALEEADQALHAAEEQHGKAGSHDVAAQQLAEIETRLSERRAQQEAALKAKEELAELARKIEEAEAKKSGADAALAASEQEAGAARQAVERADGALSGRQQDVEAAASLAGQLAGLAGALTGALDQLAEEDGKATGADQEAAGKKAAWQQAAEALDAAQRAASAATAAHGHRAGDPCPVCSRKLPSGWEAPASPDLDAARRAEHEARAACDLARGRKESAARCRGEAAGAFKAAASSFIAKATELARAASDRALPAPPLLSVTETPPEVPLAAAHQAVEEAAAARLAAEGWRAGLSLVLAPLDEAAATAKARAAQADAAVSEARELVGETGSAVAELETERARIEQARASAESAAVAAAGRVGTLLKDVPPRWSALVDPEAAEPVGAARAACLSAKQAVAAAADARQAAASSHEGAERRHSSLNEEKAKKVNEPLASARTELTGALQAVGALAHVVEMAGPHPLAGAAEPPQCLEATRALLELAGEARRAADQRAQALERQREELAVPAKTAVEDLLRLKTKADPDGAWIEAEPDPAQPLSPATSAAVQQLVGAAGTAAATAQADAERARQDVQAARDLDERLGALKAWRSDLAASIEMLKKDNFPAWARDRRIAELVDVASQLLGAMTGGRYRFDNHLRICDEVAGAVRSATTLSGGEKFEAALALALGVAEIAGRSGIRFDTLFLDEGFAGLDQPNLDRALDAIEAEVQQGRRVMLITHIGAVADRIRDVLFVEPDGSGGSILRWLDEEERFELGADLDLAEAEGGR